MLTHQWRAYWNARMFTCIFLGFTSGLPIFILIYLVQAWLRSAGVDLKAIGLFALIQFPYTLKFVWAPMMDRFIFQMQGWQLGRRRGWMLIMQLLSMVTIALLGFISPRNAIWTVAALATLLAFFSASQDIVIDAYRREFLKDNEQGLGAAIHVNAYKIASLIPGSLSLILADHLPWSMVFIITAAFMLPGIVMTLIIREPSIQNTPKTLKEAMILPFREFLTRQGWAAALFILAFIFLYRLGDSMAAALATSFFMDLGFTKTQIGTIAKLSGFWASIAGSLIGGLLLIRISAVRGLWIFGVVQILSTLGFAWLAKQQAPTLIGLAVVISGETFAIGLSTAAFTAYLAQATDRRYTATQFALFTSLAAVPRTFASASTGYIVAQVGWFNFFLLCAVVAVPGMLLLFKVARWQRDTIDIDIDTSAELNQLKQLKLKLKQACK